MVDQVEIHRKVVSDDVEERKEAVRQLKRNFAVLSDKKKAWEDLIRLIRLTHDEDRNVRTGAAYTLGSAFQCVSDKDEIWEDLHQLTRDEASSVQRNAAVALGSAFQYVSDKDKAWEDLHQLTRDEDSSVQWHAAVALSSAFQYVPDKDEAWEDLHRLTQDEASPLRFSATNALGSAFQYVPDKDKAWEDLIRLTRDEYSYVRLSAAVALSSAFQYVSDKDRDWEDLHRLTGDEDHYVRGGAARGLGFAFQHVSDKDEAWEDLHRLTGDEASYVRSDAAYTLGSAFQHVLDKDKAWEDLHRLIGDKNSDVRSGAARGLGSAFQHIPDKDEAWEDLHRLIGDKNSDVRSGAARGLGSVFQHVPDKDEAWEDLHRLTGDEDNDVRVSANHSLGRVSIFKATKAEDEEDFKSELKNAIEFFERSSKEAIFSNPSIFCLPFYRSFYSLTFEKAGAESEVQIHLAEAKSASEGSENKETLLEAVENLANALSEAHKVTDFDATKSDLKTYMQYCNRAADLIGDAAEEAPGAARVLRRGLPIIDQRIKELLEEIKTESESICKAADLPESEIGCRIGQHVATALTALATDNPLFVEREIDHILNDLERWSHSIRDENEKGYVQDLIFDAKNGDTRGKASSIRVLVGRLLTFSEDRGEEMSKYDIRGSVIQIAEGNGNVQEMDPSVNSRKVETESGDVTVTHGAAVTEEAPPEKHRIDQQKRTAIEIFADVAVHVLVYTILHHFAEDLMPVIAPILVLSALIILLLIIRNAKSG